MCHDDKFYSKRLSAVIKSIGASINLVVGTLMQLVYCKFKVPEILRCVCNAIPAILTGGV